MKDMEKKKEESKGKISATDLSNGNISMNKKVTTERNKTQNIRQKSVQFEEKSEIIAIPSKKQSPASIYDNTPINIHPKKVNVTSPQEKQDNDKSISLRSKSQLPVYNVK
jgi:hypothetical protein